MKKLIFILTILVMTFVQAVAQEQNGGRHPRVIEIEMLLTKEATEFLQQRFQNEPVYVNVNIEPLRRGSENKNEQLPYFYSEDDVGDEWDVIDTPIIHLLSRIKKATVKVEVPNNISNEELVDIREKLYEHLKLIPGRDSITIDRKPIYSKIGQTKDYGLYYFIATMSIIVFAGLFITLKFGPKSNSSNQAQAATSIAPSAGSATATPMNKMPSSSKGNFSSVGSVTSKVNGDINFKDSIRAADMLKEKLHGVVNAPVFPLLSDMLILEELANKSLSSFGAFVFEMPRKHQQKVFFRGRNDKWFKGYVEAASVDMDCFLAVEKMLRNRQPTGTEKWEELLVQIWRLGDDASIFLKQLPQDHAFNILCHLPKSFSVPCAKKTFPGAWAKVLESKDFAPISDENIVTDYLERALQIKPYFNFKSIEDYRKDLELVDYLRLSSVKDEEEIYESLNPESPIFKIRPPFYVIFQAKDEQFQALYHHFDLVHWSVALLNCPREFVRKVTTLLDDKKKYIFSNYMKQLDETPPSISDQNAIREEMAQYYSYLLEVAKIEGHAKRDTLEEKNEGNLENEAA